MDELSQRRFNEAYGRARHAEAVLAAARDAEARLVVKAEKLAADQLAVADAQLAAAAAVTDAEAELAEASAALAEVMAGDTPVPTPGPTTYAHADVAPVAAEGNSI